MAYYLDSKDIIRTCHNVASNILEFWITNNKQDWLDMTYGKPVEINFHQIDTF